MVPEKGRYPERRFAIDDNAWPLFFPPLVLGVILLLVRWWIPGGALTALALAILAFFRDPKLKAADEQDVVLAPAFGKVVSIAEAEEGEYQKRKVTRVSIFLRLWDVHINYSPVSGTLEYEEYHPGKFGIAGFDKASDLNEHITVGIAKGEERHSVKIIAGMIARRIVMPLENGAEVRSGEKIGLVKFGSRADVFVPPEYVVAVKVGDKVRGPESVIARKK